jgi:antitoxin (DNA-binding transcriptional repressor) of toxin-antitoxin stability system
VVRVTITKLRQDLFRLAERALEGETVEFAYKGVLLKMVPEVRQTKLARLTGQSVIAPDSDLEKASRDLLNEMEAEWERDWSEL